MPLNIPDRKKIRPLGNITEVRTFTLSGVAKIGDDVYINADGKAVKAIASGLATARSRGVIVAGEYGQSTEDLADGTAVSVVLFGYVAGYAGMEMDKSIFISAATAGLPTQTPPTGANTYTYATGYPISPEIRFVSPFAGNPTSNT